MRKSVVEKYLDFVKHDSKYFSHYLEWMGSEVLILKPKLEEIEKYKIAFGSSLSTFERTSQWYNFYTGYLSIDPLEFSKMESSSDLDLLIYMPDGTLEPGNLIQVDRNDKLYTYQVDLPETYSEFIYRTILKLIDVEDKKKI